MPNANGEGEEPSSKTACLWFGCWLFQKQSPLETAVVNLLIVVDHWQKVAGGDRRPTARHSTRHMQPKSRTAEGSSVLELQITTRHLNAWWCDSLSLEARGRGLCNTMPQSYDSRSVVSSAMMSRTDMCPGYCTEWCQVYTWRVCAETRRLQNDQKESQKSVGATGTVTNPQSTVARAWHRKAVCSIGERGGS